ncbi:metalloregulator ArsR/SmtB family transcription factor [Proteiniborus sp.]|uniref:ArsR/SmtB family transcription factor n=1 Tax=Proteiniborus sp. TaxID=2079015 RepID=UPI0033280172
MNHTIHNTPNWLFEAAASISEQYIENEEKVIENHNKFGMTKEEMTDYFKKYKAYKKAVLKEIIPIYNNYSSLKWLFQPLEIEIEADFCLGVSIVVFWGKSAKLDMNDTDIDKLIIEYLVSTISEYTIEAGNKELTINNLSDLVEALNDISIDDAFKMQLIKLYHTRHDTIKELWEMLLSCVPICQKHFNIIKEDFEKALEALSNTEDLEKLLDKSVGLKIKSQFDCDIYLTIFHFNRFNFGIHIDMNYYYLGIYFISLVNLKEKNRFNDNDLITDLKALGDATRLKMIHILLERKMYLQELAEDLGLTPATVSHHISTLLKSELISITVGDENARKVFYEVNGEKLESIGNSIKSLAVN